MGSGPRSYTRLTIKRIYGLSGNQCSFPGCTKNIVNENNAKDSNICHIEGANLGSERYRASMTDNERADYDNLILLCIQHHDATNDVEKYSVEALKKMKLDHTSQHLGEKIIKKPSMLRNTINAISNLDIEEDLENDDLEAFNIQSKLNHNNVKRHAPLIQEYKVYHHKINSLYDELEAQGSLKKSKILSTIRSYYLKAKGNFVNDPALELEQIRQYADDIIDTIQGYLYKNLEESDSFEEDIMLGVDLVMVDAFMRCKILEEPSK